MENFADKLFSLSNTETKKVGEILKKEKIILIGRYDAPTDYLADFLKRNVCQLVLVKVFIDDVNKIPLLKISGFKNGKKYIERKENRPLLNDYITTYLSATIKMLKFLYSNDDFGVVIGVGPFNSWLASLYKIAKPKAKIIYLCEDRVGKGGFDLKAKLTYWCDIWSKRYSDYIWFVSVEHLRIYRERWLKKKAIFVPQPIIVSRTNKRREKKLVFLGSVSRFQGADLLYRVFKKLVKVHEGLKLTIIGIGDLLPEIKRLSKQDGLSGNIKFTGFLTDRNRIFREISGSHIGIALYNPLIYKNLQYGQSAKISDYMGCGVPTVTTKKGKNTPSLSKFIISLKTGFVCDYKEEAVYNAIRKLLEDRKMYSLYQRNTRKFAKMFNADTVYTYAFSKIYTHASD